MGLGGLQYNERLFFIRINMLDKLSINRNAILLLAGREISKLVTKHIPVLINKRLNFG